MVLIRRFALIGLVVLAGCNQSLFDAHGAPGGGGGGTGPDGGMVASSCPSPCLADAAANFDGTPGGMGNHWAYLDDHRDRTWAAMTAAGATMMTGADPGNHITTCAAKSSAPACQALPGALLVSSAGSTSAADPAVEFTAKSNQVLQITVRAFVPSGDDQQIRIYRNSREDLLSTGTAIAGSVLDQAVTLDALAGDRFLVTVAPAAGGATDVGIHVYVNATGANFPSTCQIAVPFTAATGNTVDNVCGADFTHMTYQDTGADTADPPALANDGPFPELGSVASLTAQTTTPPILGTYFLGTGTLDRSHDTTLQFWVKLRKLASTGENAWIFSDVDLDNTGGLQVGILQGPPVELDVETCTVVTMTTLDFAGTTAPYPTDGSWQFVRIVQAGGVVHICLNGSLASSFNIPAGKLQSTFSPYFGMNVIWNPRGPFFDGEIDDLRVLTGALPCN